MLWTMEIQEGNDAERGWRGRQQPDSKRPLS